MSIKKGIYAASMTVINKNLSVNADATIRHAEKLIKQGCHGVIIGGSTGVMQLISTEEKKEIIVKINTERGEILINFIIADICYNFFC